MVDLLKIFDQLVGFDFTPLLLALVLGGAIGLERELHGRPAGLRTHLLVCLGATFLIQASMHVPDLAVDRQARVVLDPQRLAAGIVTGIGFLGAAAVVRAGDMVRGLTTGASIWCVAGLGVVIGQQAYAVAVVLTGAALFVLVVLDMLPGQLGTVVYRRLKVSGYSDDVQGVSEQVREALVGQRMRVQEISGRLAGSVEDGYELTFHVRCRDTMRAPLILERVSRLEGVEKADWSAPRR